MGRPGKKTYCSIFLLLTSFLLYPMAVSEYNEETEPLTLFAAASMTDVAEDISEQFRLVSGINIYVNPASSGALARQIEQGASCDVFISASKKWVDYLVERELALETAVFAGNRLVLISPGEMEIDTKTDYAIDELISLSTKVDLYDVLSADFKLLAMGDPGHVPAGRYSQEALESLQLYDVLSDKIMPTQDVRAALNLVELGEADYAIVYLTDAFASGRVHIDAVFPSESHTPIAYYCVLVKSTSSSLQLFEYIAAGGADKILKMKGFIPAE